MALARVGAGEPGVQALDLVNEPLGLEEIQRAVGNRRLRAEALFRELTKDVIGTQGAVFLQQDFQRAATHRRKLHLAFRTAGLCRLQRVSDAGRVVMVFKSDVVHGGPAWSEWHLI